MLSSPEAEIPLAFVDELEDEEGQQILRLLRRRWARPQRVLVRYEAQSQSYLCEIVQRASERSYLGKRGLKILIRDSPGSDGGWRCGRSDRGTGGRGGRSGRGRHGLGHRGRSQRGLAHAGLGRRDGRRHGQRRLAATDVQTLNGMQESGAIDHFFAQQLRQQPRVFRIDTDSESEPQAQPQQQIRARPIRRQGQGRQQPTPFGINQVPIPVSTDSDRISRQSRSDRGPLGHPGLGAPLRAAVLRRPSSGERT